MLGWNDAFCCLKFQCNLYFIFAHLFPQPRPPNENIHDATLLNQLVRFSILLGEKVLKAENFRSFNAQQIYQS